MILTYSVQIEVFRVAASLWRAGQSAAMFFRIIESRIGVVTLITPNTARGPSRVRVKRPSERRSLSRSAIRALDVMEYFGQARRPLRAIEISKALAMHPSTTDQLLKTMVDSAHLLFDAHAKTYQPSPRLAGLSCWVLETYGPDERLRQLVRDVHAHTGMVVTLATPNDLYMQIIDFATPPGSQPERGLRISVFGSVIGSAYLSTRQESEIARLAERGRIPPTEMNRLFEAVREIRRDGYADGPTAGTPVWSIAVPLPPDHLPVPLVLGLAGGLDQVRRDREVLQKGMRQAITSLFVNEYVQR
jgi:DNA-binding IclR family transcriptional regulator